MIFAPDQEQPLRSPEVKTVYELLKRQEGTDAAAIAISSPTRAPLSYKGLLRQVDSTVHALRRLGIGQSDRVATVLPNGPEMAVAFVAIAAGATCAPLNPAYRATELDFYMTDLTAKAVIVSSETDPCVREIARDRHIHIIELTPTIEAEAGRFELIGPDAKASSDVAFARPHDTALVLHTSGTTSRPKIVPLTQANICASSHHIALTLKLSESDRCLNVMPLFHIHGLIGAVLSSLASGASIICTPGFDAMRFFEWVDALEPTWYTAVPTMHQAVLARAGAYRETIARHPLRFIRSASAPLPARVMMALEQAFGTSVIEAYAMTEAAHQITSNPLAPLPRKADSVGVAAGPDVAIMDETGHLVPIGQIGEVVVRGPNVTAGYENNPAANQSAFTNGWFRTGDQGRFDHDGYLFLTGRLKEIINRGGEKIAPKEVDEVLNQHPAIVQAIAFAVPHPTLGEDIAAAVVRKEHSVVTASDLRRFAASKLADFKVPSQVLFVDEIPRGATGKLQRIGLAEKLGIRLQTDAVAPKTQIEKQLADIWKNLLHLDQVGVRDNFYAVGGDSLAVAEMILEIEARFNTTIPVDGFLRSPTIEALATFLLDDSSGISDAAVVDEPREARSITDSRVRGLKNRLLQVAALYAPGYKTTRVWLHRMRGVSIGSNVSIGLSVLLETAYPSLIVLGSNVTIGMRTVVIAHLRDLTAQARAVQKPTVRIEDDAYIGPGVIILPNVTIGHGAVVSAGSVVSSSVPPQTLVRGNPARPIARCGVSLGGGVPYERFLRHLTPIKETRLS